MPACYAHYRFGREALPQLPSDARQCIQRFRRMYDMGLNGPDIFFYYFNPLSKVNVPDLARSFHCQSGAEFFTHAWAQADTEAAKAYLYGLLGHYCLDSVCHPFVNRMVEIGEARHVALESEFERYLMEKDGLPAPHTQDRSSRIKLTRGECMTVAAFYPPATGGIVSGSVRNMAFALKFLARPDREQTGKILRRLNAVLPEHMIPETEVEDYAFQIGELQELYDQALARFPELLRQLQAHGKTGEPLGADFIPPFN